MIVTVKQHASGIAKVVNPLGTVLTVHSENETETEIFEDAVIHENCDEALFRPVVATNAVVLVDPKIETKSLPSHKTTVLEAKSVNVKNIINTSFDFLSKAAKGYKKDKSVEKKIFSINDGNIECEPHTKSNSKVLNVNRNITLNSLENQEEDSKQSFLSNNEFDLLENCFTIGDTLLHKPKAKISNISDSHFDFLEKKEDEVDSCKSALLESNTTSCKEEEFDVSKKKSQSKDAKSLINLQQFVEETKLQRESLLDSITNEKTKSEISTENSSSKKLKSKKLLKNIDQNEPVSSSSEEKTTDEKQISRKPRKSKTKLGVRIASPKEDFDLFDNKDDEPYIQVTLPAPKKTWSSVASSNLPTSEVSDKNNKIEDCSLKSSKKMYSTVTKTVDVDFNLDFKENCDNILISEEVLGQKTKVWPKIMDHDPLEDILKINKSDDEKNSSSPVETTESDDSGKINIETKGTEEDLWQPEVKVSSVTKSSKKSKRKHR